MRKRLLLDSANIEEIKAFSKTTAIAGVTTNPSLVSKEKRDGSYIDHLKRVADAVEHKYQKRHLSVEVLADNADEIMSQVTLLHCAFRDRKNLRVFVKVPLHMDFISCITELSDKGFRVNATACMLSSQAKIAKDAGAAAVSFFYNRMKDASIMASTEISYFSTRLNNDDDPVEIICGSIRKPEDILSCWESGADYVTAPFHVIQKFITHTQTDKAIRQFNEDIKEWLK